MACLRIAAGAALLLGACIHDRRDLHAAHEAPPLHPSAVTPTSWPVCRLIGPASHDTGVFGTDLGITAPQPGSGDARLAVLFGDTWARPVEGCQYPVERSDDLLATLPAQRPDVLRAGPPRGGEQPACAALQYPLADPKVPTSWSGVRLFPSPIAQSSDAQLDLGALRTPVAAWSSGERVFAIFQRSDPAYCDTAADCPSGMRCSNDRSQRAHAHAQLGACGVRLGEGADPVMLCRDDSDCPPLVSCHDDSPRGVCLARHPFAIATPQGAVAPTWYRDDARRAAASVMYVAAALGQDRPADFAVVARFVTNRFRNLAARSVARFDPRDASQNDYRSGDHTLLLWGRPAYVEHGGAQSLPFLAYVPLAELRGDLTHATWRPRFFAGFGGDGNPRWSEHESDAQPIYGADAALAPSAKGPRLRFREPESDYVNQMSVSYVAELRRWVMLYGGDLPAFMVADPSTGRTQNPVHLQPSPGAIHLRAARHPWGRARANSPATEAWSSPIPALGRRTAAHYLACGDGGKEELPGCVAHADPDDAFDMLAALFRLSPARRAKYADRCLEGEVMMAAQKELSGNPIGRLYGANIIAEWTTDVTRETPGLLPGERAVEIYWNASTWNPYQVVLFKTRLRARPAP